MNTFQQALSAWLSIDGNKQIDLAAAIGKTQAAIHRYSEGDRFPDAETARAIDRETGGAVPFEAWRTDFMSRAGLDAAA